MKFLGHFDQTLLYVLKYIYKKLKIRYGSKI